MTPEEHEHPPRCPGCDHPLDRVDHVAILHTILDHERVYRDVSIADGGPGGFGVASEIELRCGRCHHEIPATYRQFFYERWVDALRAAGKEAPP